MVAAKPLLPALVYGRVSKLAGKSEISFEVQVADCLAMAAAEGYVAEPADVLTERYSGMNTSEERPLLNEVRRRIESGKYRALIAWKTDRLARTPEELLAIMEHARKHKCKLLFAKSPDPNTPTGKLLLMIQGWTSNQEWDVIIERTIAARNHIREKGQWLGTGQPRDGYLFIKEQRARRRDPDRAPVIERIFRLAAEGMSGVKIARLLNAEGVMTPRAYFDWKKYKEVRRFDWTSGSILRIVKDRTYLGMQVINKCLATDEHKNSRRVRVSLPESQWTFIPCDKTDRLIDDDLWARANATVRGKTWHAAATRNEARPFLLRGFGFCECGSRMVTQNHVKEPLRSGYRCMAYLKAKQLGTSKCRAFSFKRHLVDDDVWGRVVRAISDDMIEEQAKRVLADGSDLLIRADLGTARDALAKAKRKLGNLADSLADEDSRDVRDAIKGRMGAIQAEIAGLDSYAADREAKLRPYEDRVATLARLRGVVAEAKSRLHDADGLTIEQKRDLMQALGVRVIFGKDDRVRLQFHTDNDPRNRITCYQKQDTGLRGPNMVIEIDVTLEPVLS